MFYEPTGGNIERAHEGTGTATFFLMNGFQIRGILTAYDSYVIVLVTDGKQQVFYKHAIPTIAPMRPLKCLENR